MKRLFFCLSLLFSFAICLSTVSAQESAKNPVPKQSKAFASANEAAAFANGLPNEFGESAQFLCEANEGVPTYPAYRVLYYGESVGSSEELRWRAQEGFPSLETARAFVNGAHALARFVACRQRHGNLIETTITVFYTPNVLEDKETYEVIGREFNTAEAAAAYANEHIGDGGLELPSFVPKFSSVSADTGLWRSKWQLIALATIGDVVYEPSHWSVAHYSSLELALQAVKKRNAPALDDHYVASFSVDGVSSSITLFSLVSDEDRSREESLVVPTVIYATEAAQQKMGDDAMRRIIDVPAQVLREARTGAELSVEADIRAAKEILSADPDVWGASIPRERGKLAILFTDAPLTRKFTDEYGTQDVAVRAEIGQGWIVMSLNQTDESSYENTLLHELGEELGAKHVADPDSVMCSNPLLIAPATCSRTTLRFDGESLAAVKDGVRAIKKMGKNGLDTYTSMRVNDTYAAPITGTSIAAPAASSAKLESVTERPDAVPCCAEMIRRIKAASRSRIIAASEINAFIDRSAAGKKVATSGRFNCPKREDGSYFNCDIYVAEKLQQALNQDELAADLAHEIGHLLHEWPGKLANEYAQDDFALMALTSMGVAEPREAILSLYRKMLAKEKFAGDDLKSMRARIAHMQDSPMSTAWFDQKQDPK